MARGSIVTPKQKTDAHNTQCLKSRHLCHLFRQYLPDTQGSEPLRGIDNSLWGYATAEALLERKLAEPGRTVLTELEKVVRQRIAETESTLQSMGEPVRH